MTTYYQIGSWIILVYGEVATGKSTFAYSSERLKETFEFDVGSLERAASGLGISAEMITYHKYQLPPTSLRDRGRISTQLMGKDDKGNLTGKGAATIVHRMTGWGDLSFKFRNDFADACEKTDERDLIVDTANLCWEALQDGTRDDIQANIPQDQWEKELKRLEFEEPNKQMWDMCNYAKANGKNLIFTARESQIWGGSNYIEGSHKPEGSRDLPGYADAVIRMTVNASTRKPQGQLVKVAAGGLELKDMMLQTPTIDSVIALLSGAAAIKQAMALGIKGIKFPEAPITEEKIAHMAETAREMLEMRQQAEIA